MSSGVSKWLDETVFDLVRNLRWSYLPPLMVYFAAGVAGLTSVVGAFFVKDYLSLSASFLAGLTFWAGLPWVLKMPIGHLVDLIWRRKAALVLIGAGLIAASLLIMYALITDRDAMAELLPVNVWFVASALLAPSGYMIQDVVADAMTVEAVPSHDANGVPLSDDAIKRAHTTMQTLGRFAIIAGFVGVAFVNIFMFADIEAMSTFEKVDAYGRIYAFALMIPVISISGVAIAALQKRKRAAALRASGLPESRIDALVYAPGEETKPDWAIFGGGIAFVALSLGLGASDLKYGAELIFAATLGVVLYLIHRLTRALAPRQATALIGTAIIIFVFRAVPLPGPGLTWFEIDVLGFDERFLSILSLITSCLTLVGLIALRPMMARWPIARIVALLASWRFWRSPAACSHCPTSASISGCTNGPRLAPGASWTRGSSQSWTPPSSRRLVRSP